MSDTTAIVAGILKFTADYPGRFGRLRTARILVGIVTEEDIDRVDQLPVGSWVGGHRPQAEVVRVIDSLIEGGVIARTYGDRPRLVLTRKGFTYLSALELSATTKQETPA